MPNSAFHLYTKLADVFELVSSLEKNPGKIQLYMLAPGIIITTRKA